MDILRLIIKIAISLLLGVSLAYRAEAPGVCDLRTEVEIQPYRASPSACNSGKECGIMQPNYDSLPPLRARMWGPAPLTRA